MLAVSFVKGLAFGFLLAATVGPMWVLCLRRTIVSGARVGLASGLGIALADAIYGAVAAFGLGAVSRLLLGYKLWIGLAGAAFLAWLGARALIARPLPLDAQPPAATPVSCTAAFVSMLGLTLANPPTILAFAAFFAGFGLVPDANGVQHGAAALAVLGVFAGSALWWMILVAGAGALRRRSGPRLARAVNTVSGATILAFAAWQLAELLR